MTAAKAGDIIWSRRSLTASGWFFIGQCDDGSRTFRAVDISSFESGTERTKIRFNATIVGHGAPAAHRVPVRVRENPLDDPRRAGFRWRRALPDRELR